MERKGYYPSTIIHQPSTAAPLLLIKLCFKMACLLGIAQASLALLSLRCAIARPKIKLFFSLALILWLCQEDAFLLQAALLSADKPAVVAPDAHFASAL